MICPEGHFTPASIEAEFHRVLSNDRLGPRIFQAANTKFDNIRSRERTALFRAVSKLFTHQFVEEKQQKLLLFCAKQGVVLKADPWIVRARTDLSIQLPKTEASSTSLYSELQSRLVFVCADAWAVDAQKSTPSPNLANRVERICISKIDGFSICFHANDLPTDFGTQLIEQASRLAQRQASVKSDQRKRGRKPKVEPLAEKIVELYPEGLPQQSTKLFGLDLRKSGITDFGQTTLRTALSKAEEILQNQKDV